METASALAAGQPPDWSIVGADGMGTRRLAAYVVFHADVALDNEAVPLVESYGRAVQSRLPSVNGLVLEMDEQTLIALANEDSVQWIEPPLPPLGPSNDGTRAAPGPISCRRPPYGLDGADITVLVYDGGTARSTHVDFSGRLSVLDASGTIAHATHVAGTIGGAGVANPMYRGMAPGRHAPVLWPAGRRHPRFSLHRSGRPGDRLRRRDP